MGGAHLDRRGRIAGATAPAASNPGRFIEEPGGGGFNAAATMARLGHAVRLISPRGGDAAGEQVAAAAEQAGIDDRPFVFLDRATPSYTAILEQDGNLVVALADMELYRTFSPRRLRVRAVRDALDAGGLLLVDANLPEETLDAIATAAAMRRMPLAAIAISPAKVVRYAGCLDRIGLLFLNAAEAKALSGAQPADPACWPDILRALGLGSAVITDGAGAVIAFDDRATYRLLPPHLDATRDVTGAGDALAAGTLSALVEGHDLPQALRHGVAAAGLTLQSANATCLDLTPERLRLQLDLVPETATLS